MTLEERLRRYFDRESAKRDLSHQKWDSVLLRVKSQRQRRGLGGLLLSLTARRPVVTIAASFVLAVMVGVVSLWMTAPWEGPSNGWFAGPASGSPGSPGRPGSSGEPGVPVSGPLPMPAPRIVAVEWEVDKSLIAPGDPITFSLTLKNVWNRSIEIRELPASTALTNFDRREDEPAPLEWEGGGAIPRSLDLGEEVTLVANMSSAVSAGLQPGRYHSRFHIRFAKEPGDPDRGETGLGFGAGSFVVMPPEGALDKTVIVGQIREANGTRIILERILFAPEETTISILAPRLSDESTVPHPIPAPTSTPVIPPQGNSTPTGVAAPPGGGATRLAARYQIDGGSWRHLRGHGYRVTAEGVHHRWRFGPVSANAYTLLLSITSDTRDGDGVPLSWEWTVTLR